MDRKYKNKKNYTLRRLVALVLVLGLALGGVYTVNKLFPRTAVAAEEDIEVVNSEEIIVDENMELAKELGSNPNISLVSDFTPSAAVDEQAEKELLIYRQNKLKEQSLGRGTKQSLLNKVVYLTFDDGPSSKVTGQILDILKEKGVKATFFVIGKNVQYEPDILKRTYEEGHQIANHGYSHNYKLIYSNVEEFEKDLKKGEEAVREVLGEGYTNNVYRFPGGSFGNKAKFKDRLAEMGYVYFDWNVLNGDAEGNNLSDQYLKDRFAETSRGYNVIISLMHDTDAKGNTARTLPGIIDDLLAKGYTFKKLGDL